MSLSDVSNFWNISSKTISGNEISFAGNSSNYGLLWSNKRIANHKYYQAISAKSSSGGLTIKLDGCSVTASTTTSYKSYSFISVGDANIVLSFTIKDDAAHSQTVYFKDMVAVDLTLLYGSAIDGMTDAQILAKFESEFPGYHSYSAGKLISNDAESIETVGFNQWDEEWEHGGLASSSGAPVWDTSTTQIRSKNFIPVVSGQTYFVKVPNNDIADAWNRMAYYDANKNYIGVDSGWKNLKSTGVSYTIPAGVCYVKFMAVAATYNHDICINLSDPTKNGTYEPYRKSTMQLGLNSFKVKSHNIWDEEWEVGSFNNDGTEKADSSKIRSKNYIPIIGGCSYYFRIPVGSAPVFWYDANKAFISMGEGINSTLTAPSNAAYMRFRLGDNYGTTYNNDICINLSSSFNGQYEPHGDITITGGLKSAGDVKDEIVGNKYVKRVGSVDLGTLTWEKFPSGTGRFDHNRPDLNCASVSGADVPNAVCQKYSPWPWNTRSSGDKIVVFDTTLLRIIDSDYDSSTAVQFTTAMSGVMLYYELATPIEYELVDAIPCITQYSEYGTQRIISPQSSTPSAPFYGEWQYGIQQGDFISGLENSEFIIGSSTYIISEEEFNEIFGDL